MRVKYLRAVRGKQFNIKNYPTYPLKDGISNIRAKAGEGALLIQCSNFVYDVTKNPSIYFDYAY